MRLDINGELWGKVYCNLRNEFYAIYDDSPQDRDQIREFLAGYGVNINVDQYDRRWKSVEIDLDDEELVMFLLRWS